MIGRKLAHYQITAHLGSGGFGDVYQATDSKLGRSVAIKLLPEAFAQDTDRASRFEREARVLASLNHPNIAAIHGFEDFAGRKFLVMELVNGETLQARLKRGPIPVGEALPLAKHIAEALEAAHETGVIHRDLKPGNVMLTGDGKVKVLDFGLAKHYESNASTADLSNSPTLASLASANTGVILGTASYMSPEQAKGRKVDKRTDIFAFGCLLYEMLTAQRVFDGEDTSEILARVLEREPNWALLPTSVSPQVRALLRLCLEKDVKKRRCDAGDVRLDLEQAVNSPETTLPIPLAPRRRQFIVGFFVAAAVFSLVGVAMRSRWTSAVVQPTLPVQFSIFSPSQEDVLPIVSVSPDGRWLVFTTGPSWPGAPVWLRPTNSTEARELAEARGAEALFWSPDSKQIAYSVGGKLKSIEVFTGSPRVLADIPGGNGYGGSWSESGVILFGSGTGIYRIAAAGGLPTRIDVKDGLGVSALRAQPQFLPDGEHFLYYTVPQPGASTRTIQLANIQSLESRPLFEADSRAQYVPPGYVLFAKGGTLWAQVFDSVKLSLIGEAQPLAQPIASNPGGAFFASQNGVLIFKPGSVEHSDLVWVDKDGKEAGKLKKPPTGTYANPSLAPDGRRVAVNSLDPLTGNWDIWIVDSARDVAEVFTLGGGSNKDPVWSPDGKQIAFFSDRENHFGLYVKSVGGAAVEQMVSDTGAVAVPTDWSPDGKFIIYFTDSFSPTAPRLQLWLLSLSDHKSTLIFPSGKSLQFGARFSHDGKWIAYQSGESGRFEIYIQDFPNLTRRRQISSSGGIHPRWGKDDGEIYYHNLSRPGVDVATLRRSGSDLSPEAPRSVFDRPVSVVNDARNQYTVTPDGQRFLIRQPTDSTSISSLTVMVNWLATLHN